MEFNRLCLCVFFLTSAIAGVSAQGATGGAGSACTPSITICEKCICGDTECDVGSSCELGDNGDEKCVEGKQTCDQITCDISGTEINQQSCLCGSESGSETCEPQHYCHESSCLNCSSK